MFKRHTLKYIGIGLLAVGLQANEPALALEPGIVAAIPTTPTTTHFSGTPQNQIDQFIAGIASKRGFVFATQAQLTGSLGQLKNIIIQGLNWVRNEQARQELNDLLVLVNEMIALGFAHPLIRHLVVPNILVFEGVDGFKEIVFQGGGGAAAGAGAEAGVGQGVGPGAVMNVAQRVLWALWLGRDEFADPPQMTLKLYSGSSGAYYYGDGMGESE